MKRERCIWIMLFIFLAWTGSAFSESTLKDMRPPEIYKIIGEENVYLEPTKFPVFFKGECSENQECLDWIEDNLSGKNRAQALDEGLLVEKESGKYMVAGYGLSDARCHGAGEFISATGKYLKELSGGGWISLGNSEYAALEFNGNDENTIKIDAGYRTTTKAHFTWTVRVEGIVPDSYKCFNGKKASGIQMRPLFCSATHSCSIKQDFSGGQIKMRLYIKGDNTAGAVGADGDGWAALDPITEMTLPALKSITSITETTPPPPGDPTTTGSRMVTKDDFINSDGKPQLPKTITFKLMWQNDSPVVAKSLRNQRNIKVLLVPVTDIKEE